MKSTVPMLRGAGTAIVTPFTTAGELDEKALRSFVAWQIEEGINYIVPCGSTGEAATMTADEQRRVVEITAEVVAGRIPVVAGAGSNDTARALANSRMMRDAGATHLLHVSPAYNKPPQRGIVAHFRAIADTIDLPVVVYNVPGRTASNVTAETTLELATHPNIVAVKEASGNLAQITQILRHRPRDFSVLSGDDALTLAVMVAGGDGVTSVTSNATPALVTQLCAAAHRGDYDDARAIDSRLAPWTHAAFVESNPIPVKAALAMMKLMGDNLRLPLVPLASQHHAMVRAALVSVGALPA
ncbi:MAG TPA: 4-hydroxy-tetrahydrodipicolinate synthase [Gemmatimonadaceae bacterium]|nr:4-hydroxy-tetrahydrodipicolinate synthase [Gemmatimonadaceae bacterium]